MRRMLALSIALAAIATNAQAFGGPGGRRPPSFDEVDADGDGVVSSEEFVAPALEHFDELDADDDGIVSSDEFTAQLLERFEEVDADDDGVVTEEELQASRPRRRG